MRYSLQWEIRRNAHFFCDFWIFGGTNLATGGTKSRNGEMRNEKLEMRKWKRKWKWSSLLLVDNTDVDATDNIGLSKHAKG